MSGRGGGWVAAQAVVLGAFAVVAPQTGGDAQAPFRIAGIALIALGMIVALWAAVKLGRAFTPFPKPVENGRLCREGPYRWIRHPIYAGVLLMAAGWAAWWQSSAAALLVPLVFAFFALKARAEERWLLEAWPEYRGYARETRAIIPFVY